MDNNHLINCLIFFKNGIFWLYTACLKGFVTAVFWLDNAYHWDSLIDVSLTHLWRLLDCYFLILASTLFIISLQYPCVVAGTIGSSWPTRSVLSAYPFVVAGTTSSSWPIGSLLSAYPSVVAGTIGSSWPTLSLLSAYPCVVAGTTGSSWPTRSVLFMPGASTPRRNDRQKNIYW